MINNNACQPRSDSRMFNLAKSFKPWIKFAVQNKQRKMVVARPQQREYHWNYREKVFHKPWNYWKYPFLLAPNLLELPNLSQNGGDDTAIKMHQMRAFNRDEKLGFVGDHVAMVDTIHSIMGWLEVASEVHKRVESKKGNKDNESNEESDSGDAGEQLRAAADAIQHIIKRHAIVVFSKSYCPFCKKTKEIFRETSVRPQYIELDKRDDGEYIQDELLKITGRRTVPQVFIYGAFVGGCSDLENLKESGKLYELLKQMPP
ncbi:hypothetical protein M758_12G147100 [Ceratodon purpureus]|uniref:Glutaredoxin domain-containing protein n=1 Tax=Ceratodon purpureus TaxID=3225 RepID=A0A8T0G744_CERPU|nr:hypothetical protein KC19_12G143600 [Ceratodon purpureus]KAG0599372.1 hypothetical protein M758_12G147100 [Ceratodon purpureus]KAG0599373.1 hypothetical protein M758_12G147100 [Ceratodon purpureus]